ncbi:MAG TPA: protein kinase [Ktedonosporobacter sp.]|jgi:serine/threonine-protein kinase|nr:protein kinase [Ktedonosporobacter sp.]
MQIEVLGERYQLQDPIGRGGMATIYRGRDMRMDRVVAIKVLREVYSTDPKFVTRFQREAKAASALQHPNIVQVYDYGQSDGNYFIVMELVEGTDLRRYLRSRGVLAIDRAIIIAHDVALGLGAAHRRGIVHRDVKPQNVLVGRDGSIKLTDFGIASVYKDINAERLTTTGMTLGTVQYYAPEQAQGEIVSPAADVYALGIVMYEMLTGRTPFDGDTPVAVAMQHIQDPPTPPSQLNPNIPSTLEDIILRCLEKVPEMRFRDGNVLARALETLGEEELGGGLPTNITPGGVLASQANEPLNKIPPRPNSAAPADGRAAVAGSSPNNRMYNQNSLQDKGVPHPYRQEQQQAGFVPLPSGPGTMTQIDPGPGLYNTPLDNGNGATRPFSRGAMPRSTVGQEQRESRFASIVTVLILLATLLLLGFSIYLAAQLGFFPGTHGPTALPTVQQQVSVPDLVGLDYQQAQAKAVASGFKLQVRNGATSGVVKDQSPRPPDMAPPGTTIQVDLESPSLPKVPTDLVGDSLAHAEAELNSLGIPFSVVKDPNDSTDPAQKPNTISRTDPPPGSTLQSGQSVTLFVVNLTNGAPTPGTTPVPTKAPTAGVTPTPTKAPTPTPTPSPTVGITPTPTPSPTP